jgi:nuclear pore complex protein Nup54
LCRLFFINSYTAVLLKLLQTVVVLKAVGYNCLPSARNEDGLVALTFDRKMKEVCDNQQAIVDTLQRIIVNNQTQSVAVCVDGTRPLLDDK